MTTRTATSTSKKKEDKDMKKFLLGVATTLVASWAWRRFDVGTKVQPYVENAKNCLSNKLASLKKCSTVED